ncbi:MAG: BLUF domain-containing protein [Sphingobacteriaceae bacterium]|nr:MAG: BLUF domain-containing protein [Sphingobacteriaceae bacterium]
MYFLIYSSYAQVEFSHPDLKRLLTKSREKNKRLAVSGMLLFLEGKFIQFLEGEEADVKSLYNTIYKDNRHKSVVVLKEGFTENRLFTDWSMAFSTVTPEEIASGEGFEKLNSASALQIFKKLSLDS